MKKQSIKFFILAGIVVPVCFICGRVDGKPTVKDRKHPHPREAGRVGVKINVDNLKLPYRKEVKHVNVKLNTGNLKSSHLPRLNLTRGGGRSKATVVLPQCLKHLSINNPNGSVTVKKGSDKNELTVVFEWKEIPVPTEFLRVRPVIKGTTASISMPEHAGLNTHLTVILGSSPDISISQKNGPISVTRLNAYCKANNVNGSIQLAEVLGNIKAQTVNGSIHLKNSKPFDRACKLESQNGSIKVVIPQTSDTRVHLDAVRGRAVSRLRMHDVKTKSVGFNEGNKLSGVIGKGKGSIHAAVTNGWIEVL